MTNIKEKQLRCQAEIKPPGATHFYRCPLPALPGEDFCPLHLVLGRRLLERRDKIKRFFAKIVEGGNE